MKNIVLALLVSLVLSSPVFAQNKDQQRAASVAKRHYPKSKVLKVQRSPAKKSQYQVKMLKKSGKVVNVKVDTKAGKVVKPSSKK